VEVLVKVAGFILDRAATLELKDAILESVADAVIQTNSQGFIQEVNPAGERLLGGLNAELRNVNLSQFILDDPDLDMAEEGQEAAQPRLSTGAMLVGGRWPFTELEILGRGNRRSKVLMSSALLPPDIGGKVFVASDIGPHERVERLELLKQVLHQLAGEIRVPLALAATFLADASKENASVPELVDKALKQIRKADLPLERVLRLEAAADDEQLPTMPIDLRLSVMGAISELPTSAAQQINVLAQNSDLTAYAAKQELGFCVQSLLSYLIRARTETETVEVKIGQVHSQPFITMGLSGAARDGAAREEDGASQDLSLAEPVLHGLMRRMGGKYAASRQGSPKFRLVMATTESANAQATHHP